MISWVIIELPPGDYIDIYILDLTGGTANFNEATLGNTEMREALSQQFGLDKPTYIRYGKWVWRMFHGDLGNSLEFVKPVTEVVGERLILVAIIDTLPVKKLNIK